jgi:hypothetical protein
MVAIVYSGFAGILAITSYRSLRDPIARLQERWVLFAAAVVSATALTGFAGVNIAASWAGLRTSSRSFGHRRPSLPLVRHRSDTIERWCVPHRHPVRGLCGFHPALPGVLHQRHRNESDAAII